MRGGLAVRITDKFQRDYARLPQDLLAAVDRCIEDLVADPIPASRRAHSVTPRGHKPTIYTVDVTSNKAYKLSFYVEGRVAVLLRVGSHGRIDRSPG